MATTKTRKAPARKTSKPKAASTKSAKTVEARVPAQTSEKCMKGFFAKKFDPKENILTIFKSPRIYGAILGEVIGTMLLTFVLLLLGVYQPLYIMFGVIAISAAVYGLSGANLNPIVTAGMMATRRMSAIRGILYLLAQLLGAWLAYFVSIRFISHVSDEPADKLPAIAEIASENFFVITMLEFMGAIVIAFFFARALAYKRSALTFAAIYGTGMCVALLIVIVLSSSFLELQNNFIMNPAAAFMYKVLPTAGENFGEVFGAICQSLLAYVVLPMVGGVIGFYLADFSGKLSGECLACGKGCDCKEIKK